MRRARGCGTARWPRPACCHAGLCVLRAGVGLLLSRLCLDVVCLASLFVFLYRPVHGPPAPSPGHCLPDVGRGAIFQCSVTIPLLLVVVARQILLLLVFFLVFLLCCAAAVLLAFPCLPVLLAKVLLAVGRSPGFTLRSFGRRASPRERNRLMTCRSQRSC